ncbi:MAG: ABC transporter permease [Chitinophagaceae bacterium]|nr:ABC transporter permease [Chitinophagaceae bacterium]
MHLSTFRLALRHFAKHKLFTVINIAGLAIGISAALVIYLIVQYEYSFDKQHKDGDRIYRTVSVIQFPDLKIENSGVPVPTVKAAREELTGMEAVTFFSTMDETNIQVPMPGSETPAIFRKQKEVVYADNYFFTVFDYAWLAGSAQVALKDPFRVVLTEDRAKTYFGTLAPKDIIGREIIYSDTIKATVSGIVKKPTQITDFTFQEFVSVATVENTGMVEQFGWNEWGSINSSSQMFVKLNKGTQPSQVEKQFVALRDKYRPRDKEHPNKKDDTKHALQPLSDIHFNAVYDAFNHRQANKSTLAGLLAVAAFLLILGCINFINLTTAQASQRAKEIGIRKTMGSSKMQLVSQFLTETLVLTLVATLLSIALSPILLNVFKDFIPDGVSFNSLNQPHVWIFLAVLVVVVSVLAGFYPALVLTRFKPVTVLKNQAYTGTAQTRKAYLRKTLTVTQFVIAQFLVIATLIVSKQINFSINKELGYKREAIVTLNTRWNFFSDVPDNRRKILVEKIKQFPEIEKISLSGSSPASGNTSTTTMKSKEKKVLETMVERKYADTSYFGLYGMKLIAGRNLQQSDTTKEFVINETYARMMGFENPADAVGQMIDRGGPIPIVGVLKDFHSKGTQQLIKPLAYASATENSFTIHLALKPRGNDSESWKRAMAKVEKEFKALYPEDDFQYSFFDETIAKFYQTEQNISRLLKWSAALCIFISCLGLLGLAIFVTNTRTKEIGVRKVLGASVTQIISLLSKDFIALVALAFLIALPFSYWAMHNWLQDFQYRTAMSWWVFAATGGGMIMLAMIVLSLRTIKSATENPVKNMRTE